MHKRLNKPAVAVYIQLNVYVYVNGNGNSKFQLAIQYLKVSKKLIFKKLPKITEIFKLGCYNKAAKTSKVLNIFQKLRELHGVIDNNL